MSAGSRWPTTTESHGSPCPGTRPRSSRWPSPTSHACRSTRARPRLLQIRSRPLASTSTDGSSKTPTAGPATSSSPRRASPWRLEWHARVLAARPPPRSTTSSTSSSSDELLGGLNALDQALGARDATWQDSEGKKRQVALRIANASFGQNGWTIEQAFLDALASTFGSGLHLVDYESDPEGARRAINGWVDQRTAGRIPELLCVTRRDRVDASLPRERHVPQGRVGELVRGGQDGKGLVLASRRLQGRRRHDGPCLRRDGPGGSVRARFRLAGGRTSVQGASGVASACDDARSSERPPGVRVEARRCAPVTDRDEARRGAEVICGARVSPGVRCRLLSV